LRTTLTIDDDLAGILQRRSRELGQPFKKVLNAALRKGLADEPVSIPPRIVKTRPHDFGTRPGIDWDRLNQLVDELEIEVLAVKPRPPSKQQ
jgi:hypothetical protein